MKVTDADRLLKTSRTNSPERSVGCAFAGPIAVTWHRIARVYEVGTTARVLCRGPRAVVMPVLLLALTAVDA